jgi:hypothetical protein
MKGIMAIVGGAVVVLIGTYLIAPVATATTAGNTSLAAYSAAQSLENNIPLFFVLGIVIAAISLMVVAVLKE